MFAMIAHALLAVTRAIGIEKGAVRSKARIAYR
jgi:hypothetical protein